MSESSGPLLGAIDQGTSSSRFLVFSAVTGRLITSHQIELRQTFPNDGWVEMDPIQMLEATKICIFEACQELNKMSFDPGNVKAVGISNQRETTIVWDRETGRPLYNAIVWLDGRTAGLAREFTERTPTKRADHFQKISGLPIHPYFSALKLRWMLDNVDAVKDAVRRGRALAGTVDSWLIWNLTGGPNDGQFVTDVTNASRTGLMNLQTCNWDKDLCNFYGIPQDMLAEIRSSAEVYGILTATAPKGHSEPLLQGVPLAGCLGDQQAALVGQGCLNVGSAKNTYGTGCFLLYNTGTKPVISNQGLLTTVGFQLGPNKPVFYALEGSVAIAGAVVRWLRDNLGILACSDDVEVLANSVQDCGGVYFVPAFTGLYAPYWHSAARGIICGLSQYSTAGHVSRSALEAVSFQTREILDAMKKDCGIPVTNLKCDGGMVKNLTLMQIQADILGQTVTKTAMPEATALGAAIAAGVAPGIEIWDVDKMQANAPLGEEFKPMEGKGEREKRFNKWKQAVKRSMNWVTDDGASVLKNGDVAFVKESEGMSNFLMSSCGVFGALVTGILMGAAGVKLLQKYVT